MASLWHAAPGPSALPALDAQKRDYERVNSLLAAIETEVKAWSLTDPWQDLAQASMASLATFSIKEARDAAWVQGEVLSSLGGPNTPLGARYLEAFDGVVGLAGRGLLISARR